MNDSDHRHDFIRHTHNGRTHDHLLLTVASESELTLREALEWALDNLEAEDEFLGSPVEGEQTTYTVIHAGRTVTMARSTQYAEGIRKARAALATPESELTGDGLRAADDEVRRLRLASRLWEDGPQDDVQRRIARDLIGTDDVAAALAALPNREAAPEGLRALRDAVHEYLWSDPGRSRDRALANLAKAHDAATEAIETANREAAPHE